MKSWLVMLTAAALTAPAMAGPQEVQPFDSEAAATSAGWSGYRNRPGDGASQDFGFSSTGIAGGSAGEAGGVFTRTDVPAYYADATIGSLTLADALTATGTLGLQALTANNEVIVGWMDLTAAPSATSAEQIDGLGFRVLEGFRVYPSVRFSGDQSLLSGPQIDLAAGDTPASWSIEFDPDGGVEQSGRLVVTITDVNSAVASAILDLTVAQRAMDLDLNGFGVMSKLAGSTVTSQQMGLYLDNVTYSSDLGTVVTAVPSPAAVGPGILLVVAIIKESRTLR